MLVTVFAKEKQAQDGKKFTVYNSKLSKKNGEVINVSVSFRQECGSPKKDDCPCNIEFDKADANLSEKTVLDEDTGEAKTYFTLWISNWKMSENVYVDHSLDDFE